jgi:hypothetical protein
MAGLGTARQGWAGLGRARRGAAGQGVAGQGIFSSILHRVLEKQKVCGAARLGAAVRGMAGPGTARQGEARIPGDFGCRVFYWKTLDFSTMPPFKGA